MTGYSLCHSWHLQRAGKSTIRGGHALDAPGIHIDRDVVVVVGLSCEKMDTSFDDPIHSSVRFSTKLPWHVVSCTEAKMKGSQLTAYLLPVASPDADNNGHYDNDQAHQAQYHSKNRCSTWFTRSTPSGP